MSKIGPLQIGLALAPVLDFSQSMVLLGKKKNKRRSVNGFTPQDLTISLKTKIHRALSQVV